MSTSSGSLPSLHLQEDYLAHAAQLTEEETRELRSYEAGARDLEQAGWFQQGYGIAFTVHMGASYENFHHFQERLSGFALPSTTQALEAMVGGSGLCIGKGLAWLSQSGFAPV